MSDDTAGNSTGDTIGDTTGDTTDLSDLVAFHDPVRRRLVDVLTGHGPSTVTSLARALDLRVGSVSHHLRTLERAGFVEPAPELATDGRTSWWRLVDRTWHWSPEDFDQPADRHRARAAQRLAARHQGQVLNAWAARQGEHEAEWRRAAFSTEVTTRATAPELAALLERLDATVQEWLGGITRDDGQQREPVTFFGYGLPVCVDGPGVSLSG
ncbi:helix-turn-helix domain-containing protein [Nocardioides sp.]|uniref:ArsR/SmtB family transcription factor n=1 Tax=Nocardioides sp. TaxID=35761 RepID=UPI00286D0950|nr:helix-turn-helix domain-containing protein [Nocardioides sp.]